MKVENIYPVLWRSGPPTVDGQYLCAIPGYSKPIVLTYYKKRDGGYTDCDKFYGSEWISRYMRLDDIPMPEGW